jgi:predicted ABC-type ATPase
MVMIGGPNGAGKTTAATDLLPKRLRIDEFVNADEIAERISPGNPEVAAIAAGRATIVRVRKSIQAGRDFAFETTCAGRWQMSVLNECAAAGYRLTLVFLWLPSPDDALARVARRVAQGGHNIPREVVIRRYAAGLRNMRRLFLARVDQAIIYDNSDGGRVLIADKTDDGILHVRDPKRWDLIVEAAR